MHVLLTAALDAASILIFAALGRQTHQSGGALTAVLSIAWPFLVAAAAAWVLTRAWRDPRRIWPTGIVIWLLTAIGGLLLRGLAGGGLAPAFQLVAAGFLALSLLGHRFLSIAVSALADSARRRKMN